MEQRSLATGTITVVQSLEQTKEGLRFKNLTANGGTLRPPNRPALPNYRVARVYARFHPYRDEPQSGEPLGGFSKLARQMQTSLPLQKFWAEAIGVSAGRWLLPAQVAVCQFSP